MVSLKAARWKVRYAAEQLMVLADGKVGQKRKGLRFQELFLIKFESSNRRLTLSCCLISLFSSTFHPSFVFNPLSLQEPRSAARASAAVPLTQPALRPTKSWRDCRPRRKRPTRTRRAPGGLCGWRCSCCWTGCCWLFGLAGYPFSADGALNWILEFDRYLGGFVHFLGNVQEDPDAARHDLDAVNQ